MQPAATKIVHSGHGLHGVVAIWREREDASPGEGQRRIEEVLRLACAHIGGDPKLPETARLMKVGSQATPACPGRSCRSRSSTTIPKSCTALAPPRTPSSGNSQTRPSAKPKEANGHTQFKASEWTGPIETETALAEMRFGSKDNSIHKTQLKVLAKLISEGQERGRGCRPHSAGNAGSG